MSYILDALKKSEREKTLGKIPSLETILISSNTKRSRFRMPWWGNFLVFMATLAIFGLGFYWYGLISYPGGKKIQNEASAQAEHASKIKVPKQYPSIPVKIVQPPSDFAKEAMQSQASQVSKTVTNNNEAQAIASSIMENSLQPKIVDLDEMLMDDVEEELRAIETYLVEMELLATDSSQQVQPSRFSGALPDLAASAPDPLSETQPGRAQSEIDEAEYSQALPEVLQSIGVNVVSYSENRLQRFIMLDMVVFKEGDRMENDVQIIEIQSAGVVVEYKGEKYMLKPAWF